VMICLIDQDLHHDFHSHLRSPDPALWRVAAVHGSVWILRLASGSYWLRLALALEFRDSNAAPSLLCGQVSPSFTVMFALGLGLKPSSFAVLRQTPRGDGIGFWWAPCLVGCPWQVSCFWELPLDGRSLLPGQVCHRLDGDLTPSGPIGAEDA